MRIVSLPRRNWVEGLTREEIAFEPLDVYILESKCQDEGAAAMVQWRAITKTAVAAQKIEPEQLAPGVLLAVDTWVAHAGEIFGKPVRLQAESTCTLEMYDGVLT